jgi:DNA-binding winged helix-turn-helix (wHTH) protein
VLQLLVENPGEILTKGQILQYVWSGKYTSSIAVRVCIREIRQALPDEAKVPRYIETVGRKGYRYIGPTIEGNRAGIQGEIRAQ